MTATDTTTLSRRAVVGGALAVGAGGLLVGCGSDEPTDSATTTVTSTGTGTGEQTPTEDAAATTDAGGAASDATVLAAAADVPVGGGVVNADAKVVVTQPTEGEFKGFSAVCTHQKCTVASVADGVIKCPCHQSAFSVVDGSVQGGPASNPLPAVAVAVDGANVVAS